MGWFRLYHDLIDDPRFSMMPELHQLLWIKTLCLASANQKNRGVIELSEEEICWKLRIDSNTWNDAKSNFHRQGLLTENSFGQQEIQGWEYNQKYRDRPPVQVWRSLREQVFLRDDFTCQYCGNRGVSLQCDHIIPSSRGGSSELANLTTACRFCNQSKHNKTPEEWLGSSVMSRGPLQ